MSTSINTLFKPITVGSEKPVGTTIKSPEPSTLFNTNTSTTATTATTATTTTTTTTGTTAPSLIPTTTTTSTLITTPQINIQKENTRYIPPVFFIGAIENNTSLQVGPDQELIRSGSLSLGHGERRLSTVFPEDVINESKQGNTVLKILVKPEVGNRGLFGDGTVKGPEKAGTSTQESKIPMASALGNSTSSVGLEIEIVGYKQNREKAVKDHFSQYGTIVKYETVNGKLVVQFKEPSSATLALKDDGFVFEGEKILVKLRDPSVTELNDIKKDELQKLPPSKKLEMPSNLYKNTKTSTNKLGSGQHGITALDKNTSISATDKPKEVSFQTRFLEFIRGW